MQTAPQDLEQARFASTRNVSDLGLRGKFSYRRRPVRRASA